MNPSVGKKLSLFVATVVVLALAAMGFVSYRIMEARFANVLRADTLDTAALLSSRIRNELRHVAEKGRFLAAAALEDFRNPEDQARFLQDNLTLDEQFVALSLFRRSVFSHGKWVPVFRLTRPDDDPAHLTDADFGMLDLRYPLDFNVASGGDVDIAVGALRDGTPLLRMLVPIVRVKGRGFTQVLAIEIRQERITAAFADSTSHFSFILDRNGRVLSQTDPTHFTLGEDLSHLPILQMARATDAPNGNLDYYEVPGASLQYASFHKVGYADLVVVSQAPKSDVVAMLRDYTRQAGFLGGACVFLAAALTLLACFGIIGLRLRRIGKALGKLAGANFTVPMPEANGDDEIGEFARVLQSVCDEMDAREKVHGTFAKLRSRRFKTLLAEGQIALQGARGKAYVLHCQLRELDALASTAEPEAAVGVINELTTKITSVIEAQGGVVDRFQSGSILAFWGMPAATDDVADRVFYSALMVREIGRTTGESLKQKHFPAVSLAMGLAYGTVVAGEIGTGERREYTLIGSAVDLASRIQGFADQFGTDLVVTGDAARTAPQWYSLEQVASGDKNTPELFELVASARQGVLAPVDQPVEAVETDVEVEATAAETPAEDTAGETETGEPGSPPSDDEASRHRKRKQRKLRIAATDDSEPSVSQPPTGESGGHDDQAA